MADMYEGWRDEDVLVASRTDPDAFGVIVDRYQASFMRKARQYFRDEDVASDAVQEALVRIYVNAAKFVPIPGSSFKSWAYTVLANQCATTYRKLRRRGDQAVALTDEMEEVLEDRAVTAGNERRELSEYVLSLLSRLPESVSKMLRRFYLDERTHKEIASEEGITEEAARQRLHRARKELRKLVDSSKALALF